MLQSHYNSLAIRGESEEYIKMLWIRKKAEMYCYLGRALSLDGHFRRAVCFYKKSIYLSPLYLKPYLGIMMAFLHI